MVFKKLSLYKKYYDVYAFCSCVSGLVRKSVKICVFNRREAGQFTGPAHLNPTDILVQRGEPQTLTVMMARCS